MRSVGAALPKIAGKYAGKRAPLAQLRAVWPDIAGREIADQSLPEKLLGLPRGKQETERAATLRVRCSGVAALELQHRQSELIERINAFFGYRAIERIVLEYQAANADREVTWTLGDVIYNLRGGMNRLTGDRSRLSLHSIIACDGIASPRRRTIRARAGRWSRVPNPWPIPICARR